MAPTLTSETGQSVDREPPDGEGRIDLERLFDTYGIAPLPLSAGRVPLDLVRAYHNWCDLLSAWPELDDEPWLPVGSIGPLLILGHYLPQRKQAAILPPWISGRALVQEDVYRKIAASLRESHAQNLHHSYEAPVAACRTRPRIPLTTAPP
jgi:hypothetical protein